MKNHGKQVIWRILMSNLTRCFYVEEKRGVERGGTCDLGKIGKNYVKSVRKNFNYVQIGTHAQDS